jgi:hypothetical protein
MKLNGLLSPIHVDSQVSILFPVFQHELLPEGLLVQLSLGIKSSDVQVLGETM